MDRIEMGDPMTLNALRRSGLLKFYRTSNMRSQVRLLETLVRLWDHELGMFDLQGETLDITAEDIYFVTGLFNRVESLNLGGTGRGGDLLSVQDYVNTYCLPDTQKSGTQIPTAQITSFPLKVLVSTVVRVVGSSALPLATWTHMCIAVECL